MHVVVATDGSKQSLAAARKLTSFADPSRITGVTIVAVVRPLAAVAFADELSRGERNSPDWDTTTFRDAAQSSVDVIAKVFDGWGPSVRKRIRSGSPANEIIKEATAQEAGLIVVAAGGRGLSDTVLMGSTAQRVQHYAPCPVLVVRPKPRKKRAKKN